MARSVNRGLSPQSSASELCGALVGALVEIPFMAALPERRFLITLMRRDVNSFPEVAERSEPRLHIVEIVFQCLAHPGGLRALQQALSTMAPDAPGTRRTSELLGAATLLNLLQEVEAADARKLLRQAAAADGSGSTEAVLRHFAPAGSLPAVDQTDLVQVFDHWAEERNAARRVPTAVCFVDAIAHGVEDAEVSQGLMRWAEQVVLRLEAEDDFQAWRRQHAGARPGAHAQVASASSGHSNASNASAPSDCVGLNDHESTHNDIESVDLDPNAATSTPEATLAPPDDPQGEMMPPVATSSGRSTRLPLVWGDVPQRNPSFTGREALLRQLHEDLTSSRQTAVLPQALHGMGGVGKSQVAIEYVHRHSAEYDLIWWIPAEQPNQILESFTRLAERLELGAGPEANVAVPMVREALSTGSLDYEHWLLVFDNAEAPDDLQRYFPTGGAGKILVTSRDMDWARVTRVLEVDVFEREESIQFLRRRNPDLERDEADKLAEALGDLPVAIEQAAAWRAATGMPINEYLELLENKRIELLDASPSPDYRWSVAAAWQVSLDKLREINPGALQLLQVCSFLAPEPINRDLFAGSPKSAITPELDPLLSDAFRLSRAIRDIHRYALARIDHRHNTLQIHRLIQAVLIAGLPEEERRTLRNGAHTILANNTPTNPDSRAEWPRYQALLPHVLTSGAVESADRRVHDLVFSVAKFLYYWGDHQGGQDLIERAYECRVRDRGPSDSHTLTVGKWLGFMLWVNGEYARAKELNAQLLARYHDVYGDEDEGTIDAMTVVSADHRAAGDFIASRDIAEQALAIATRVFGEDDPATLRCAHNLCVALRWTAEFTRAEQIDMATYERSAIVVGPDSDRTLNTLNGLGVDRLELGRYIESGPEQEEAYRRHLEAFGVENPSTLRAARILAVARRKVGNHASALELSRDTLERLRRRYGDTYPWTLAMAVNHAVDLRHDQQLDMARDLSEQTAAAYDRIFGPRHCLTLSARTNLAVVLRLQGDPAAALELNMRTLEYLREELGPDHVTTQVCLTNTASDLAALNRVQEAFELDTDVLDRNQRILGDRHPTTLACSVNLALDLRALGRVAEADHIQSQTMVLLRQVLGDRHPATLNALQSIRADCDVDPMPL